MTIPFLMCLSRFLWETNDGMSIYYGPAEYSRRGLRCHSRVRWLRIPMRWRRDPASHCHSAVGLFEICCPNCVLQPISLTPFLPPLPLLFMPSFLQGSVLGLLLISISLDNFSSCLKLLLSLQVSFFCHDPKPQLRISMCPFLLGVSTWTDC